MSEAPFLDRIFIQLKHRADVPVLSELHEGQTESVTGTQLLTRISAARRFLLAASLRKGDRCVLLANNGVGWVAANLAVMAEGLISVPLYARQAPVELVAMMQDCSPSLIICGDETLRHGIASLWKEAPRLVLLSEVTDGEATSQEARLLLSDADPVTIIYTSGTSGVAKGVILTVGNVSHMLTCTSARLDLLMDSPIVRHEQDRVFHYLPFCFAGSWILLLTCLQRGCQLALNADLNKLAGDLRCSAPDYFLNVPALLERMRRAVDEQLWQAGGVVRAVYIRAKGAWVRKQERVSQVFDGFWLGLANALVFPTIRKKMIGSNLKALICGSAPLTVETQLFYSMLGIRVLQVYGLTETTAICTMDDPRQVEPGRVGPAIPGVEMKLGESEEILVRGPNVFLGYWNRPEETASVLCDGWFRTGDQGEVDADGNWKIVGRIKNLVILGSGHNIAPEPIEDKIMQRLVGAQQVVVVGDGRGYLSAIITGKVEGSSVQAALDAVNLELPHYKQVRAFLVRKEAFSIENGLLTANGKLKRDAIAKTLSAEIEEMYRAKIGAAS